MYHGKKAAEKGKACITENAEKLPSVFGNSGAEKSAVLIKKLFADMIPQ